MTQSSPESRTRLTHRGRNAIALAAGAAVVTGVVLPATGSGTVPENKPNYSLINYIEHTPHQKVKTVYGDNGISLATEINNEQYRGVGPRLSQAAINEIGEVIAEHGNGQRVANAPDGLPQFEVGTGQSITVYAPTPDQIDHINKVVG